MGSYSYRRRYNNIETGKSRFFAGPNEKISESMEDKPRVDQNLVNKSGRNYGYRNDSFDTLEISMVFLFFYLIIALFLYSWGYSTLAIISLGLGILPLIKIPFQKIWSHSNIQDLHRKLLMFKKTICMFFSNVKEGVSVPNALATVKAFIYLK